MTHVSSKRDVESMPRKPHQRARMCGQPYTRVERIAVPNVQATPEGPKVLTMYVFQITGYTLETKFVDEEWTSLWEEHDLGQASTLPVAHETAGEWRRGLVGEYAIV